MMKTTALILCCVMVTACSEDEGSGETSVDTTAADTSTLDTPSSPPSDTGAADATVPPEQDAQTQEDTSSSGVQDASTNDTGAEEPSDIAETDAGSSIVLPSEKPPIAAEYETFIGDWTMSPGKETTKCTLKRLDNVDPIFVTGIKVKLAQGSHHLIVYKSEETEEKHEPFKCTPFTEGLIGGAFPLIISQKAEEHLEFPNGVAIKLEPNQMVRIEAHFLNYFPEDIIAHADVTFETIEEEDVVAEANMLFYGTPDFEVKANTVTQTPWNRLTQWSGTNVFALTGHTHKLGTNVEVYKTSGDEDDGDEIYPLDEQFDWAEAPVIQYDPPLSFSEGEGFRYRCSWDNPTDQTVGFGESSNQEMCFFWAYYYPSQGYRLCVNAGQYGADFGIDQICCPGSPLCGLVDQFL